MFGKDDGGEDLLNQTLVLLWGQSSLYSGAHPGFQAILPSPASYAPGSPQPFPAYASTLQAPSWAQHPFPLLYPLSPVFKA